MRPRIWHKRHHRTSQHYPIMGGGVSASMPPTRTQSRYNKASATRRTQFHWPSASRLTKGSNRSACCGPGAYTPGETSLCSTTRATANGYHSLYSRPPLCSQFPRHHATPDFTLPTRPVNSGSSRAPAPHIAAPFRSATHYRVHLPRPLRSPWKT